MNKKPILFSGEMVRAILDGRKTQTRRVVKFPTHHFTAITGYTFQNIEHANYKLCYPMPKGGFVFWCGDVEKTHSDAVFAESDDGLRALMVSQVTGCG